ncbi:adenosylcobinamide-GDP ribazoletransferase [Rheinheimera tangshanensis]|jgi:adenosylcobinamide-GDP ribazoletransferase|uniref:Adenosylcobinamide-GDP ribazoletransferase n=1 Tax=Rheinheimera tangshanensis TaxID=400153 RepID=A0A5C8LZM9_9GAMM|nr:adenosylcobinamide-GDP ribazoletransferase [Rheinheimera tangshanensis]TXK81635.1 adenosylcobinamide-GDP ribazoletransferase [Rheinheimera tangshanensis]
MSTLLQWPLRQWQLFCLALAFFSRIPVPASTPYSPELLNQSSRYLSLVGLLLGALQALVLLLAAQLLPFSIAVLLSLISGLVLTGAFHEDGLADTADGLGGGLSLDRKLEIMKDSRVGTYGLVALFSVFLIKWQSLFALDTQAVWALVLVAGLSRATAVSLTFVLPYQQLDVVSKSKPIATSLQKRALLSIWLFVLPFLYFIPLSLTLSLLAILALSFILLFFYYRSQLQGYTGDLLGAAQQVTELSLYLVWLIWWRQQG